MKSLWNDAEAAAFANDPVQMRVYTSRLIGKEADLVLHGGGNTSVKVEETNIFGEQEKLLYVKGSGWDLATIEAPGFAPCRIEVLQKAAQLDALSDSEMVKLQRSSMTNPSAPNPSVEAILHAIIPFRFVDHTHTDAVVTLTNTPNGEALVRELYGPNMFIVPYIMPGFILAKEIYQMTKDVDWQSLDGMILLNHGVFTFHDDARVSYEKMIEIVSKAEEHLAEHAPIPNTTATNGHQLNLKKIAELRQLVSKTRGKAMVARLDQRTEAMQFSAREDVASISTRGPLTPDHVIRTKRIPLILQDNPAEAVAEFVAAYQTYFDQNNDGSLTMLDPAPRWAVWPHYGTLAFGDNAKGARIVRDIVEHTVKSIQQAEALGGWKALPEKDIFEMEYWELEQAKLKKAGNPPALQGKVALVTGAASGIGKACAVALHQQGAAVVALDINPAIAELFNKEDLVGKVCDVTDEQSLVAAIEATVTQFGGLDMVVSNAGIFPSSATIAELEQSVWDKSMSLNLSSHEMLLHHCYPYLKLGIDPAVVIIGSKNVPAPGPGAGAYSVAKAGLTQLARVAAMEWGKDGIRVNVIHPNAVYDTAIWTEEVLSKRATHYGLTVEEYKTNNLLKTEVNSSDVAALALAMVGPAFAKTTGAQVPIDGGNDRVV